MSEYLGSEMEKQAKWETKLKELEKVTDRLGEPIESGIIKTVAVLNLLGFPTSQSCEGHVDRGLAAPWVMINAPNEPVERYIGETAIYHKMAKKYNTTFEQVKRGSHEKAWEEAVKLASDQAETEEFKKWSRENDKFRIKLQNYLVEFYKNRKIDDSGKLQIEVGGDFIRLHNGGADYEKSKLDKLSDQDRAGLTERLDSYRVEMEKFTNFLIDKYLGS